MTEFNPFVLLSSSRVMSTFSGIFKRTHLPIAVDLKIVSNPRNYIVLPVNKFLSLFTVHADSMTRRKSLDRLDKRSTWGRYQSTTNAKSIRCRKDSDVRQVRAVTRRWKRESGMVLTQTVRQHCDRRRATATTTCPPGVRCTAARGYLRANWRKLFQSRGAERRNLRVAELRYGEEVR